MSAGRGKPIEVAVVGAGIIGACTALALAADGHKVTLLDEREPGHGCSYGNAGQYSTGSSLPLAMPGMVGQVARWLASGAGPLSIRLRDLPGALPWLIRWLKAGRESEVRRAYAALHALHRPCVDLYRAMLGPALWAQVFRPVGALHLWRSAERSPAALFAQALREEAGVRAEPLTKADIADLEPALAPIYANGLLFPDNGIVADPLRLVEALVQRLREAGGSVVRARVTTIRPGPPRPTIGFADHQDRACDAVVVAAGAWSRALGAEVGLSLPVQSERGYHIHFPDAGLSLRRPVTDADSAFVASPLDTGLRIVGIVEIAAIEAAPDPRQTEKLRLCARAMLPGLNEAGASLWTGSRPSTPDSVPLIGSVPRRPGLFVAAGHGHTGLSGAPMTARLIADVLAERTPSLDPSPFRLTRFPGCA